MASASAARSRANGSAWALGALAQRGEPGSPSAPSASAARRADPPRRVAHEASTSAPTPRGVAQLARAPRAACARTAAESSPSAVTSAADGARPPEPAERPAGADALLLVAPGEQAASSGRSARGSPREPERLGEPGPHVLEAGSSQSGSSSGAAPSRRSGARPRAAGSTLAVAQREEERPGRLLGGADARVPEWPRRARPGSRSAVSRAMARSAPCRPSRAHRSAARPRADRAARPAGGAAARGSARHGGVPRSNGRRARHAAAGRRDTSSASRSSCARALRRGLARQRAQVAHANGRHRRPGPSAAIQRTRRPRERRSAAPRASRLASTSRPSAREQRQPRG